MLLCGLGEKNLGTLHATLYHAHSQGTQYMIGGDFNIEGAELGRWMEASEHKLPSWAGIRFKFGAGMTFSFVVASSYAR